MIRTRTLSFLLALMCLATAMLGPAVADEQSAPRGAFLPPQYQQVIDGQPGALESLQLELMTSMLRIGLHAYGTQTGEWPASGEILLGAGLLPFRPQNGNGEPIELELLDQASLPDDGAIGLKLRPSDCTLFRMGADGDPLAPEIAQIDNQHFAQLNWLNPYPWSARLASHLESTLWTLCGTYATMQGQLPATIEDFQSVLQLRPVGCLWQEVGETPMCGVRVEVDPTRQYLRTTRYPDPGYGQHSTYALTMLKPGCSLLPSPLAIGQASSWIHLGTLVWADPLPESLTTWHQPPIPAKDERFANMPLPANRFANQAVLSDWSWLIDWHVSQTQSLPNTEWLLTTGLQLHDPLDVDGNPVPIIAAPFPAGSEWPKDWPLPSDHAVLYVGPKLVQQYLPLSDPEATQLAKQWAIAGTNFTGASALWTPSLGTPIPQAKPDPAESSEFQRARDVAKSSERQLLEEFRWTAQERDPNAFGSRYAFHAAEVFAGILCTWEGPNPDTADPAFWANILARTSLAGRGYSVLAPGSPHPSNAGIVELSRDATSHAIRVSIQMPNGLTTVRYARISTEGPIFPSRQQLFTAHSRPEIALLDYLPIATFAIPIPDPPVLPEVAVP